MTKIESQLNIICLESEAFYSLVEKVVDRLSTQNNSNDKVWINDEETLKLLDIGKSTLQKYRDEGKIRYSKTSGRKIIYYKPSILEFIENNAKDTF